MLERVIASWLVMTGIVVSMQTAIGQAARDALNVNKLLDAETIIHPFEQGESFVKVTINLSIPQDISRTNWRSAKFRSDLQKEIHNRQQQVLESLSNSQFGLRQRFQNLPGFSAEVTLDALEKLSNNLLVESIEPVFLLEPHLSQGINLMNALTTRSTYNGQGVSIAICDSGIDYTHPALGGGGFPNAKVIGGYDTGDHDFDPIPQGQGHGTCCAGIAAGDIASVGDYIGGVAYGSKLYALKITTGSSGSAYDDDIAAAWDWCVSHQYDDPNNPIMVISTSFGGGRYFSSCDSSSTVLINAANTAAAAGITLLVSSGNDGYCDSLSSPACISSVISVGAVYDASFGTYYPCVSSASCAAKTFSPASACPDDYYATDSTAADKVASYSNTASFLDILAPSNRAYTTDISGSGGYELGDYFPDFGGTSAACPYAAGVVAILQSASKTILGDYLTPDEVRNLLVSTGDDITDVKVAITKPRVNLGNAMSLFYGTPPIAYDVNEVTEPDTPVTVMLNATDEGLPNPPGVLSYIITSMPNHGIVADPNDPNTPIISVPYTLSGSHVIYSPRVGCDASVMFTYTANDGGTTPDGGDSNEAAVHVDVNMLVQLYSATMDTDPGWIYEGDWQWGIPQGSGGAYGNPDPTAGFSGTGVVGYNLSGDYKKIRNTEWATTPAIDCNDFSNVYLSFYRWLNVEQPLYDHAYIEVSNDGSTWVTIWENTAEITDASWTFQTFDISSVAANQMTVYVRWGMGETDSRWHYSGWNIDDVSVTGLLPPANVIIGDLEPDCDVDVNDLMRLIDYWMATCGNCDGADLVEDGIVNLFDLEALAQNWLTGL